MPDYVFDGEGMEPGRVGGLVVPLRRVLRRLQRPWFDRQVEIFDELRRDLDATSARIAAVEGRQGEYQRLIAELRAQVEAQEARAWDDAAIAGRLAALEDATRG
ncbi:MAG TPA: hypothetical protein VIN56_08130 [Candidatus Dormibacteraeota bacterium]